MLCLVRQAFGLLPPGGLPWRTRIRRIYSSSPGADRPTAVVPVVEHRQPEWLLGLCCACWGGWRVPGTSRRLATQCKASVRPGSALRLKGGVCPSVEKVVYLHCASTTACKLIAQALIHSGGVSAEKSLAQTSGQQELMLPCAGSQSCSPAPRSLISCAQLRR